MVEGQAVTNGAYICDVTPLNSDEPRQRASLLMYMQVARVVWPSGSELRATLSCPVAVPMRKQELRLIVFNNDNEIMRTLIVTFLLCSDLAYI